MKTKESNIVEEIKEVSKRIEFIDEVEVKILKLYQRKRLYGKLLFWLPSADELMDLSDQYSDVANSLKEYVKILETELSKERLKTMYPTKKERYEQSKLTSAEFMKSDSSDFTFKR